MFGQIGYAELVVLGIVAVILFGKRLPEVARSVGQSYAQLRKGLAEMQSSIRIDEYDSSQHETQSYRVEEDLDSPGGKRFEPPQNDS
jgi:sec-independent protein translocase protein TatA